MKQFCERWMWMLFPAILAVCSLPGFSQTDIKTTAIGPYIGLARNAVWGSVGRGNIGNAYIYTPQTSGAMSCVYLANNNPTNSHSFTLKFLTTGDPTIAGFYSQSSSVQQKWHTVGSITDTVAASSVNVYSFNSLAAAYAQVQISGTSTAGGSPDTGDIYLVESNTSINCASSTFNAGSVTVVPSSLCNKSSSTSVATSAIVAVSSTPPTGQFIHVCGYSVSQQTAPGSPSAFSFNDSTSGTCSTASITDDWILEAQTVLPAIFQLAVSNGQMFQTAVSGVPLCFNNSTGSIMSVSISYFVQ